MGKWDGLIRKLGGVPLDEVKERIDQAYRLGQLSRKPVEISRSIEFYAQGKPGQEETDTARRAVIQAMAMEMEERGCLVWKLECLPNQDGKPVKRYRMRGTLSVFRGE